MFEDPDPQQLVLAWDEEKKSQSKKPSSAKSASSKKAAEGKKRTANSEQRTAEAKKPEAKSDKPTAKSDKGEARAEKRGPRQVGVTHPTQQPVGRRKAEGTEQAGRATRRVSPTGHGKIALESGTESSVIGHQSPSPRAKHLETHTQNPEPRTQNSELRTTSSLTVPGSSLANGNGNGHDPGAYTGEQIQILEGVQHIRQRPGMYIGTTSTSGLLHLVYEAIDNVVDEFNAGYGSQMWISIGSDGRVTVRDEARGIPVDPKDWGGVVLPTATWIFIKPFTGGKFEQGAYKQAGGLHGLGLTVINALSSELEVDIWRDGQHFRQLFHEGQALDYSLESCNPSIHGTQIRWLPDPTIFDEDATYDVETLLSRLEATACLNRGLCIDLSYWDEEVEKQIHRVLHSQNGLADYVKQLIPSGAAPLFRQPISIVKSKDDVAVEVVLQPDSGYKTQLLSFANGVRTPDGGTHETGFKAALTKVVNDYALKTNLIKDRSKESLKPDVIQQGLSAIISVKLADPQFQGQTKNRLNNAPVEGIVRSVVIEGLVEWFETNQSQAKEWLKKIHLAQKARNEAQMAEELARTGQKKGGELIDVSLSKKFAACNGNDPSRNELFIVEGESAGGRAKQARRSEFQAILALKGKPLNVANASLQRILDNEEIRTIISVVGTGTRHVFDIERLKFHKIIILSDADVDGSHIVCLLLTFFHQEMPGLIENGHIYLGCPPLYSVKHKGKMVWLTDDEARKQFLKQHPEATNLEFKRYKGLGEMNASELRETTMDQSKRVLRRVTMEDSAMASKLVNDLMARENAEARRALLARQAKHLAMAGNLDV